MRLFAILPYYMCKWSIISVKVYMAILGKSAGNCHILPL